MKKCFLIIILWLVFVSSVFGGGTITARGGEQVVTEEFVSPMTISVPAEGLSIPKVKNQIIYWKWPFGNKYLCDNVFLQIVEIRVINKSGKYELEYIVQTETLPGDDKTALVEIKILNDEFTLGVSKSGNTAVQLRLNAEEEKTRVKSTKTKVPSFDLEKVMSGGNPRIEIMLEVEDN